MSWIAAVVALLAAGVIPAHYYFTAYGYESARLMAEAVRAANALSEQIHLDPGFSQFDVEPMRQTLFDLQQGPGMLQRRVFDLRGELLVGSGGAPDAPVLRRSAELTDGARTVGRVEVAETLRPVWRGTLLSAGLGGALGLAMFVALRILPMRALMVASQRLESARGELEAAQQDLQRNERLAALGQLTATVSRELRNPLGTIRTSIFTIAAKIRGAGLGLEPALERVERNVARCDTILSELLDYARTRDLALQSIVIDAWLDQLLDEQALPGGVVLGRALHSAVTLPGDEERLRRVMVHVLNNACDALSVDGDAAPEHSERIITVESRRLSDRVEILVSDTGRGIPSDVLPRIFDPLYSTRNFGVGLGLATVKQIMEQHGGGVSITNRLGGGAEVRLWLPLYDAPRGAAS